MLAAFFTGALLGLAGCTLQSVLRNPLAEPYMLGITGGGSLAATAAIHFGWAARWACALPVASFAGSCGALALVAGVAWAAARRRSRLVEDAQLNAPGNVIVLAGFAAASFAGSLQMLLLSFAAPDTFATVSKWLFGDLRHVRPEALAGESVALAVALAALLAKAAELDVLALGADRAECLGIDTRRLQVWAFGVVSLATAAAVASAGAIGFVGLVAPHAVKRFAGERLRRALPFSAIAGGVALMVAECVGRALPGELSAGVVCALAGAPFFFVLLILRRG